jgi:hypothetical protein
VRRRASPGRRAWSSSELEIRPTCALFGAVPDDLELDEYDDAAQVLLRRERPFTAVYAPHSGTSLGLSTLWVRRCRLREWSAEAGG